MTPTNASLGGLPADRALPANWVFAAGPPDRVPFERVEFAQVR